MVDDSFTYPKHLDLCFLSIIREVYLMNISDVAHEEFMCQNYGIVDLLHRISVNVEFFNLCIKTKRNNIENIMQHSN